MDGRASFNIAAPDSDLAMLEARSAGIWIGLTLGDDAFAEIRRVGVDPAALRLTGLHPFEYAVAEGDQIEVIAHANDNESAEALLDLFHAYFLPRLQLSRS